MNPIDHSAEGVELTAAQYREAPRFAAWLASYLASHDIADSVLQDVEQFVLNILEASGVQLDSLGRLIGEHRAGQDDIPYRLALAVRVMINRSNGTVPELIDIAATYENVAEADATYYTPAVHLTPTFPAAFEIEIRTDPVHPGAEVHKRMTQAAAAGVGVHTITTPTLSGLGPLQLSWNTETPDDDLNGLSWNAEDGSDLDADALGSMGWAQSNQE